MFQRNYDWRVKDCKRLFDDIIDLANDTDHGDRKHFMGAFVCKFNKFVDLSFNQYILIDGQQRLTSITLILKALYDHLGNFGDKYEELRDEIKETYLINKYAKDFNLKLKLKPNQVDNDNFNKLMDDEEIDLESTIGRNYTEFKKMIGSMTVSIENFYNAIQRLEGVVVFLDDTDNPQVIFESLNSTGLELTDADLIRNYLLMNCKASVQEKLYKDYWLKLEKLLGANFLQFIKDFLSLKNGIVTSSTKNYTYTAFQKYYRNGNFDNESFLKSLLEYGTIYNRLICPSADSKDLLETLKDYVSLDIKTTYPFVFGLLIDNTPDAEGKKKISDSTMSEILDLMESYLIRRNVCNLAGGGMSQVMASLYNELVKKHGEKLYVDTVDKVAMALAGITTKAYFPKDDEFAREFAIRDMYHSRNVAYILKKIELYHQDKEIVDFDNLTVEHIMPQTINKEWKDYLNRADWEEFHTKYVHRIGNLSLTAYNSEMSNKPYKEKKAHIDFSRLTLNDYFKDVEEWKDEAAMDARASVLADLALKIWPFPKVTNIDDIATESHFFLEDDDYEYAGTNPAGIQINSWSSISSSWVELYSDVLRYLYNEKGEILLSCLLKKENFDVEKPIISKDSSELRTPKAFIPGYYLETNNNTEMKTKILKTVLRTCQYEEDDVIIFIK